MLIQNSQRPENEEHFEIDCKLLAEKTGRTAWLVWRRYWRPHARPRRAIRWLALLARPRNPADACGPRFNSSRVRSRESLPRLMLLHRRARAAPGVGVATTHHHPESRPDARLFRGPQVTTYVSARKPLGGCCSACVACRRAFMICFWSGRSKWDFSRRRTKLSPTIRPRLARMRT